MKRLFIPLVILSQVLAIVTIVTLVIWTKDALGGFAWDGSLKQFNWHPLLMILGMVLLNGFGILTFRLLPMLDKPVLKVIHLTAQGIIVILGAVALKGVFAYQNAEGYANVHMVHSWVGFPTYLMFGLQWICGFLIFFFPKLSEDYRSVYMPLHRYSGVALFAMAIVAAISGIQEEIMFHLPKDNNFNSRQLVGDILGIAIVSFALLIGFLVTESSFKRTEETQDSEKQPLATSEMRQFSSLDEPSGSVQSDDTK